MTKAEQRRLTNWRLKVAPGGHECRERRAHLPAFRDFPEDVLQVEAAVSTSTARPGCADRARAPHRSPRATPAEVVSKILYLRQHYHFGPGKIADYLKRFHERVGGLRLGASHSAAARHEPAAGQSEASAARATLAALREAAAGASAADGREVSRAHSGHAQAALSVHRDRRLHAHSRAEGLRRVQPAHGDPHSSTTSSGGCRSASTSFRPTTAPSSSRTSTGISRRCDIRHVYIRPRTPHLNGKVERSHRVDDQEFYQLLDKDGITDDIHLFNEKLREWEDYYNYHRPHGALDGQTPYERLLAKTRAGASPAS